MEESTDNNKELVKNIIIELFRSGEIDIDINLNTSYGISSLDTVVRIDGKKVFEKSNYFGIGNIM